VDGIRIRKEKAAYSKISGYVWTGPYYGGIVPLGIYDATFIASLLNLFSRRFYNTGLRLKIKGK